MPEDRVEDIQVYDIERVYMGAIPDKALLGFSLPKALELVRCVDVDRLPDQWLTQAVVLFVNSGTACEVVSVEMIDNELLDLCRQRRQCG